MTAANTRPRTAGLYEDEELRAERIDGRWHAEVTMRDVGSLAGSGTATGLHEFDRDGVWTPIGDYRTLRFAKIARDLLKNGTHFVQSAHSTSCGDVMLAKPARLVTNREGCDLIREFGLADADA